MTAGVHEGMLYVGGMRGSWNLGLGGQEAGRPIKRRPQTGLAYLGLFSGIKYEHAKLKPGDYLILRC
jgi:hypothetical protein